MDPIRRRLRAYASLLGRNVVFLGIVSGLTDVSSEMLYPIMPLFLTQTLHAPMTVVGLIEGLAEAAASLLKAAAGAWSDRRGRRKIFVVWGYGLSALSKPLLALAGAWPMVLFCRLIDRAGKGVRTPARDALLAASVPAEHWGKAFGFHRAMDTAGAAAGPLVAVMLMSGFGLGYRALFLIAAAPALLALLVLAAKVRECVPPPAAPAPSRGCATRFSPAFKRLLLIYGLFALGNSSDAFLLLKAAHDGLSPSAVVLAYVLYNCVYALAAAPAGAVADRIGSLRCLALGMGVFAAVYLGFASAARGVWSWPLFALYGFYGALSESSLKAAIAQRCEASARGAALGAFQAAAGGLALAASLIAGWLWSRFGACAPFAFAAACAAAGAAVLFRESRSNGPLQK
ncbi:MAG: MFS transporter [Elusimicrobia bacterium]|nr:MFS transporter [Elusimicrobiota bacterium]